MNLREWAIAQGVHPQTAYRWLREGTLPVPVPVPVPGVRVGSRTILVNPDAVTAGLSVVRVESEVGSGVGGSRVKVRRLLADPDVQIVVVEHRERLGRVNVELVEAALSAHGRRLVVLDAGGGDADLAGDMVEVLTSLCARLYGRRSARSRAVRGPGPDRGRGPDASASDRR